MGDIRGAVRILSSEDTVLPSDASTLQKLKEKHPPPHPHTNMPPPPEENLVSFTATRDDVKDAIKSFRNGSGGGQDALLPQHLKDITGEELGTAATDLLDTLADFVTNVVFSGNVPSWMCPIFYGAKLLALSKKI